MALDRRSFQHGVKFLQDRNDTTWLIWSSSPGNPPEGQKKVIRDDGTKCSYFTHDIYFAPINQDHPSIQPQVLISFPEAQEPVDAAVATNGSIAITYEDGSESNTSRCYGVIKQRYKIFSQFPQQSKKLETVTIQGAHSGHIAAVGNNFVIVYAEGWIDGGGVNQAGTANDIYVDVVSSNGRTIGHKAIAVDKGQSRDWWPLVAGSSQYALLAWQRFITDSSYAQLVVTVYDPAENKLVKPITVLKDNLQYYHYDVQYLAAISRFLIVGNYLGSVVAKDVTTIVTPKFFAFLLDEFGEVVDYWENETICNVCGNHVGINLVREARPAIVNDYSSNRAVVLYPTKSNAVIKLVLNSQQIMFDGIENTRHSWFPLGTDGMLINENNVLFANLTPTGVKLIKVPLFAKE